MASGLESMQKELAFRSLTECIKCGDLSPNELCTTGCMSALLKLNHGLRLINEEYEECMSRIGSQKKCDQAKEKNIKSLENFFKRTGLLDK